MNSFIFSVHKNPLINSTVPAAKEFFQRFLTTTILLLLRTLHMIIDMIY